MSDAATKQFTDYILDGKFIVANNLEWNNGKPKPSYRAIRPRNPDFNPTYNAKAAAEAKLEYNKLQQGAYSNLPQRTTQSDIVKALRKWETDNSDKCEMGMDNEEFRYIKKIHNFFQVMYVQPVRDAVEDAQESRNSVLSRLMATAVNDSLEADRNIVEFKDDIQNKYNKLMSTVGNKQLKHLEEGITRTVKRFAPEARVDLKWEETKLTIEPKANVMLSEDGYVSVVGGAGHGLQRILIMSMLQHLEEQAGKAGSDAAESPTLMVLIDEPELYQHPNRQRHMSEVLRKLTDDSARRKTQIIYSTHSPHFVRVDEMDQIRLVRKGGRGSNEPKATRISSASLSTVADKLAKHPDFKRETNKTLKCKLQKIMTPMMNEGFFADVVVLVEGISDNAALSAVARSMGYSLDSLGISIISGSSKENLPRLAAVFKNFGIPLYIIWDKDGGDKKQEKTNRQIMHAIGLESKRLTGVYKNHACLKNNLEDVIKKDLGDNADTYISKFTSDTRTKKTLDKKMHSQLISAAMDDNISFKTLEKIIRSIIKLRQISISSK